MKKLKVTVNGIEYEVLVEEVSEVENTSTNVEKPVHANMGAVSNSEKTERSTFSGEIIEAPMPGTIISINVQPGKRVSKGDVLLILEAMKMENEIVAPRNAVVSRVSVNTGDSVQSGTPLVELD